MDTVIGLLELVAWIVAVVGLAAAVTFSVIKLFPSRDEKKARANGAAPPQGS
jgi:hypothetical protein